MTRAGEAGFTMTEIMVSVLLVGIAAAFTFSIQVRSSAAFRDQTHVSEAQQGLRAASELITRDLRNVGFLSGRLNSPALGADFAPVLIDNNASDGTDVLTIFYADPSNVTYVPTTALSFDLSPDETTVGSSAGFANGDLVVFGRTGPNDQATSKGHGCILQLTGTNAGLLQHSGITGPWNQAGNTHCDLTWMGSWNDGYTRVGKLVMRSYRIRPSDGRGVLEMSPTGGLINDWQALALGIVDLQVAVRVYNPDDLASDLDGDGDTKWDWYSGDGMETVLDPVLAAGDHPVPVQLSVTLVARTTKEVSSTGATRTPDLTDVANPDNNALGDHAGTDLPVTDTASLFFGNHVYRTMNSKVDLRNLGVGLVPTP